MLTKTPESRDLRGFLSPFVRGGLILRLGCLYFLRSNHLLTAFAITPAKIEERNEKKFFILITPFHACIGDGSISNITRLLV